MPLKDISLLVVRAIRVGEQLKQLLLVDNKCPNGAAMERLLNRATATVSGPILCTIILLVGTIKCSVLQV
jgi:hypothetical protein